MANVAIQYRGKAIVLATEMGDGPALMIDGRAVEHAFQPGTGRYATALLPYAEYDSLEELARAVVDHVPHFQPRP